MPYPPIPTSDYFGYATAVLVWTPGNDPINVATIPLQPRTASGARIWITGPSYVPGFDLFPQGGTATDVYNFPYWGLVDLVVAMAGEFGIPSPGWINAAHLNGVQVLGSIVTYHQSVYNDFVSNVLKDPNRYILQLAEIASYYGFDGWFIDIEPNYPPTSQLQGFLESLTAAMHEKVPGSIVMFYSPYYPQLTSDNAVFFQVPASSTEPERYITDALFLDYGWTESSLKNSASYAENPLKRSPLEVYGGINVALPQNQFDSWKQVQYAVKAGVSAALWGAGWPFQTAGETEPGRERLARFWFGPRSQRSQPQSGLAAVIEPRAVPATLPFCTSFNSGRGRMFQSAVGDTGTNGGYPWSDMGLQDVLPSYWGLQPKGSGKNASRFSWDLTQYAAYDGGSSLLVSADAGAAAGDAAVFALFATSFPTGSGLRVRMVVENAKPPNPLALALGLVFQGSNQMTLLVPGPEASSFASIPLGQDYTTGALVDPSQNEPAGSFTSFDYTLPMATNDQTLSRIFLLACAPNAGAATGTLARLVLAPAGRLDTPPGQVQEMALDPNWQANSKGIPCMNGTLTWDRPAAGNPNIPVRSYDVSWVNVNGTQYWLDRVTVPMYVLSDFFYTMDAGSNSDQGRFVVQAIGMNGAALTVAEAASIEFTWKT